jgi:nucleotide-binding universal stress UspA family protein
MLSSIIAPVDFSNEAGTALKFAAEIAKRASAKLTIIHANPADENEAEAKQKLSQLLATTQDHFGADLRCEAQIVTGDIISVLTSWIKREGGDLIVMGTKGASGLKKIFIGSNTMKVIGSIKLPILVIPETVRFEEFNRNGKNRVILATDLEELEHETTLDILEDITSLMIEPKLRIVNVRPKNTKLNFQKSLVRSALVSGFSHSLETEPVTVFSDKVLDGINFYLSKNSDTGLIAMVARDSSGLFPHHFTQDMASITHYPLLVLNDSKG